MAVQNYFNLKISYFYSFCGSAISVIQTSLKNISSILAHFKLNMVELGGTARNWVDLGGTRRNWVELGGIGWNWEELGGTGRKLGESGRNWVDLGGN